MTAALDLVRAGYDRMAGRLARAMAAPPADPALSAEAGAVLATEARWLDARAFDRWLGLLGDDMTFWIPVHPGDHPARDQALIWDDRRRIGERVQHFFDRQAWAVTAPAPIITRRLGPVEAWEADGEILATAAIDLMQLRRGPPVRLSGREVLSLRRDPGGLRVTSKTLILPELCLSTPHLGWIL